MSEEQNFIQHDSLISNLDRLSAEQSIVSEQRFLELYDIASEIAEYAVSLRQDSLTPAEAFALIGEELTLGDYPVSEILDGRDAYHIRKYLDSVASADKAALAELCVKELSIRGVTVRENDFLPPSTMAETFIYVRNSFSDEAYDVFSADFTDPRVKYASSFRECASLLQDGSVSYCLLPLEERGGVRLPTVSELIYTNDFKINSVISVFGPDANADVKYALVSKSFTAVGYDNDDDDRYLELRLDASSRELAELFTAVLYYGMTVFRLNTFTVKRGGESDAYLSVVVKDGGKGFSSLLVYLTLWGLDFTPVGLYKNLE